VALAAAVEGAVRAAQRTGHPVTAVALREATQEEVFALLNALGTALEERNETV
jgi:hypothetical protein